MSMNAHHKNIVSFNFSGYCQLNKIHHTLRCAVLVEFFYNICFQRIGLSSSLFKVHEIAFIHTTPQVSCISLVF